MNCVGDLLGEELIAPLVLNFQIAHPDVRVNLDFSSVRVDLIEQ